MRVYVKALPFLLAACGGADVDNATPAITPAAAKTSPPVVNATPFANTAALEPTPRPISASSNDRPQALPADVVTFEARRDECDHFRGEDADDEARAAQLERDLNRTCKGTDAALAGLHQRHAGNAAVIAALSEYEADVEWHGRRQLDSFRGSVGRGGANGCDDVVQVQRLLNARR